MDTVNQNQLNSNSNLYKIWYTEPNGQETLIPYQKYQSLIEKSNSLNSNNENSNINNNKPDVLDLTEQIRIGMLVMTDWGEGKVISINKTEKTLVINIEGNNHTFNISNVNPLINIFICVVIKNITNWLNLKILSDDNCFNIKSKIAKIYKCNK